MDFNKLTLKSQEAVARAQELARRSGNPEITPDHLLLALLEQELPQTLAARASANVDLLREAAQDRIQRLPSISGATQQPQISTTFLRVLDEADEERRALGDDFVSVEHLLLALGGVDRNALLAAL